MYKKRLKTNRIDQLSYYVRLYLPAFKIRRDINYKSMNCGEFSKNRVASSAKLSVIFMETHTPKEELKILVTNFRTWLKENYSTKEIEDCWTDDPSYPNWGKIENYFKYLLDEDLIATLDDEDKVNLLYLIARNWDLGSMLAWLSQKSELASLGTLREKDFIELSKTLVKQKAKEFNDAKAQFVSTFRKFGQLTSEIQELLLEFYHTNNEYIKRCTIDTLAKLKYKEIRELIEHLWVSENDELVKRDCLVTMHTYLEDPDLLKKYISLAEKEKGKYLKEYIKELKSNKNYR
jgi:hypothetical protein